MINIMKNILHKIVVFILVITLGLCVPTRNINADGFDGDIMENPFAHLFVDGEPGDAVIGNQVQKPTVQATKKRLKKLLKTSIKSATRKNKESKKAKVKTFKNNKITIKKLKVRRNYYIKARAYAKGSNGEKVYGKWTKRKMIKFRKKK